MRKRPASFRFARKRTTRGASEIAEFIPALYILFLLALMPMIDLGMVFVSAATQYLATNDIASKAASQNDYNSALNDMANEAYQFQNTGFAKFVNLLPQGGYTGCGADLYVHSTDMATGAVSTSPANQGLNQTIDPKKNLYEISVSTNYTVRPIVSLASIPILGTVPGLGVPAEFSFSANRPVERAGGLQTANGNFGGGAAVQLFPRVAFDPSAVLPNGPGGTWRHPDIFTQIQNAGKSVVNISVLIVPGCIGTNSDGWVNTGINILPGQQVWLDTQAQGSWNNAIVWSDANGAPGSMSDPTQVGGTIDGDLPNMMLIGYTGSPPSMPWGHSGTEIFGDPKFIPSGDYLLNYPITNPGPLWLAANDNQASDLGYQYVRVIVTQ